MSRTRTPVDDAESKDTPDSGELAGEISEVIERHGRGRDADSLLQALEEVFDQGGKSADWEREPSRGELQRALMKRLEACSEDGSRKAMLRKMEKLAEDLRQGSLRPEVEWRPLEGRPSRLMIRFDSSYALTRRIPEILDIRGFFLECEARPPMLEDLNILVGGAGVDPVKLEGKVVRTAANGIALQIYGVDERTAQALRALRARIAQNR